MPLPCLLGGPAKPGHDKRQPSPRCDRPADGLERLLGAGAVGTAGLGHVGPAAATLAAKRLGGGAHQVHRIEARP
jgi:hypothetical protein